MSREWGFLNAWNPILFFTFFVIVCPNVKLLLLEICIQIFQWLCYTGRWQFTLLFRSHCLTDYMTTVTNTDAPSQLDQQLELLCSFNVQIPCNPLGEFAASNFNTLLQSLNKNQICDSLRGSSDRQSIAPRLISFYLMRVARKRTEK